MKNYLLILCFSILTTVSSRREICHACFDSICYSRSQIFQDHPILGQLAVERTENVVYFHYEDQKDHTVAFDLDDIRFLRVPDMQFSFARTVDQATRDVYFGGETGVYKYSPIKNITTLYGLSDKTIWQLQYKNHLYYTVILIKGLYTYEKKQTKVIAALKDFEIDDFIVDKKDDIYFVANFTVYKLRKGDKKANVFSNIIYSLSTDIKDNAYFVHRETRALYKIDYSTDQLIGIGAFGSGDPLKFVFDRLNNLIYYDADRSKLYYLVPNYGLCKVKTEALGRKISTIVLHEPSVSRI